MKGDCYKISFEILQELKELQELGINTLMGVGVESLYLVHGTIVPITGSCAGKEIKHAWVEVNDVVVEMSNGNNKYCNKEKWIGDLKAYEICRYNPEEAIIKSKEFNHYGPWI